MIAILATADAPGTTTTLGLAAAFGRLGEPTVAVGVDERAPTLHAVSDVEREPTIAALTTDAAISEVVQTHPHIEDVGVVPGPLPTERVDVTDALDRLTALESPVLVDCPIGVGPVGTAVLSRATRALIVVGASDRALDDAETIANVARRSDVSITGIVLAAANSSPATVAERLDAPVLATFPGSPSATTVAQTRDVFDGVAPLLNEEGWSTRSALLENRTSGRLETGIDVLDRKLDGGLPPGCVVAYTALPASQSELLLYELTAARETLYITTERTEDIVRHAVETSQTRVGRPTVRYVASDEPITEAHRLIGTLPDGSNLIVDTMNPLERADRAVYRSFLNDVKARMVETGSIALLHCLKDDSVPKNRSTTEHVADAVFDLETTVGTVELENYLSIPKFRGGSAPTERIKLELAEKVTIDTSRDIA